MKIKLKYTLYLVAIFFIAFGLVYGVREYLDKYHSTGGNGSYELLKKSAIRTSDIPLLTRLNQEYALVTSTITRSVVSLDTIGRANQKNQYNIRSIGSGVIVSRQGHIVTNNHVVENKQTIQVTLYDGRMFQARIIGTDKIMDLAVLKIDVGEDLTPIPFGNSDEVQVGQFALAVGNPYGLGETVTQGIISAKQRNFGDLQGEFIQTDAAINPGNSGGPLTNVKGEIIGINSSVFAQQTTHFQGMGFAIPSNTVKTIFEEICEYGRPIRGYIGVDLMNITPQIREETGLKKDYGVAVNFLYENSPAEKAGLRPGDVILSYGGQTVDTVRDLLRLIYISRIGKPVDVVYWRKGKQDRCRMEVVETGAPLPPTPLAPALAGIAHFGLKVKNPSLEDTLAGVEGVIISDVIENSKADKLKFFLPGDLIVSIDGKKVANTDELIAASGTSPLVTISFRRGRPTLTARVGLKDDAPPQTAPPSDTQSGSQTSQEPDLPDLPEPPSNL